MFHRRGFTLIELLVVIAVIAILAAMSFPVFARARCAAQKTCCLSNQKQMLAAWLMYTSDYDNLATLCGSGATVYSWLSPYLRNTQVMYCPCDKHLAGGSKVISYGYNHTANGLDIDRIGDEVCRMVVFADSTATMLMMASDIAPVGTGMGKLDPRHNGMLAATYVDGHAKVDVAGYFKPSMFNRNWTP